MPQTNEFTTLMQLAGHDNEFIEDCENAGISTLFTPPSPMTPTQLKNLADARQAEEQRAEG